MQNLKYISHGFHITHKGLILLRIVIVLPEIRIVPIREKDIYGAKNVSIMKKRQFIAFAVLLVFMTISNVAAYDDPLEWIVNKPGDYTSIEDCDFYTTGVSRLRENDGSYLTFYIDADNDDDDIAILRVDFTDRYYDYYIWIEWSTTDDNALLDVYAWDGGDVFGSNAKDLSEGTCGFAISNRYIQGLRLKFRNLSDGESVNIDYCWIAYWDYL